MSKVGQPAQPPKLPCPRSTDAPSPITDLGHDQGRLCLAGAHRSARFTSQPRIARESPCNPPPKRSHPLPQEGRPTRSRGSHRQACLRFRPRLARNFEERGIQEADKPFHDREKGAWLGGSRCCSSLSPWPTGSPDTFSGRRVDYAAHRGLFHRALELVFEGLNGRPFSGPSRAQLRLHSSRWATEKSILSTMYIHLKTSIKICHL